MNEMRKSEAGEIVRNLEKVQDRINAACLRSGRNPEEVTLIAVSKTRPYEAILEAFSAGRRDFGENYVQELTKKMDRDADRSTGGPIRWHMIGHLQRNKVKYLIGKASLIHAVDSVALAETVEKESGRKDTVTEILLEVNVGGEESKFGFAPGEVREAAEAIIRLPHVRLLGLMTSAPYTESGENNRMFFRALKNLAETLKAEGLIAVSENGWSSPALSMGMSCDYEVAVEEGATLVRVGTDIFGERNYG